MSPDNHRPRKRKGGNGSEPAWLFVDCPLSMADKERLGGLDLDEEFPWSLASDAVAEGYNFKLTRYKDGQQFVASLTDVDPDSHAYRRTLSGWGASPTKAFAALMYRHLYLLEGDWPLEKVQSQTEDFR